MHCPICKHNGYMRRCLKCGMTYCSSCATKGKINGNKVAANRCPYCNTYNQSVVVK